MTTYLWNISQMDTVPSEDGLTDVVMTAHWQCTGTQENEGTDYAAQVYGTCSFALDKSKVFIPYDSLTPQEVLDWCWASGVDKDATQATIDTQIANQINPPIIVLPLPWIA
jgi:hypothetical protein